VRECRSAEHCICDRSVVGPLGYREAGAVAAVAAVEQCGDVVEGCLSDRWARHLRKEEFVPSWALG
jgi:hypothetical protein